MLAGIQGNGQTELVEAIVGMRPVESGTIFLNGTDITNHSPRAVLDAGLGHIPEDRQRDGLVLSMSVADNLVLNTPRRAPFARRGSRNLPAVRENAARLVKDFDIRTTSINEATGSLSGGNQQKVVIAKSLVQNPDVIIFDEPTRGVDVGAIAEIHAEINRLADEGKAVVVISSYLPEVMSLSDRILVARQGKVVTEFAADQATQEAIMYAAIH
jgi:simple sugar transport system ATP-binding protein